MAYTKHISCRYCGKGFLAWDKRGGKPVLVDWNGKIHNCHKGLRDGDGVSKYSPVFSTGRKQCVVMTLNNEPDDEFIEWVEGNYFVSDPVDLDRRHSELLPWELPFDVRLAEKMSYADQEFLGL